MLELTLGTVFMGLATASLGYVGSDWARRGVDYVERDLRKQCRLLRMNTRGLRRLLIAWAIFVTSATLSIWIGLQLPIVAFAIAVMLICMPWYVVRRLAERRKEKIDDQLADSMVSLSSAIKAGLSLGQALEILAQQMPKPICQEFQQIVGEYQLGKPLEQCFVEAKQRLRSENFALFAAAMDASRQSGGRLNETVDRIAHSVRELQRLERKVRTETAQARASAVYMALAPVPIFAINYFLDPESAMLLFTTFWGQCLLATAFLLNVIAYLWARAILNPDI